MSREGVQRDLLPIVEGSTVQTRYGYVRSDHILFIAAGAFHVSKPSDLIPELQGRFPIRVELQPLTEQDFVRIMTEPENALTKQYQALVAAEGAELEFTADGIAEVARVAFMANDRMENIGARRLHTVMAALMEEVLFELPDYPEKRIVFDAAEVRERLAQDRERRRPAAVHPVESRYFHDGRTVAPLRLPPGGGRELAPSVSRARLESPRSSPFVGTSGASSHAAARKRGFHWPPGGSGNSRGVVAHRGAALGASECGREPPAAAHPADSRPGTARPGTIRLSGGPFVSSRDARARAARRGIEDTADRGPFPTLHKLSTYFILDLGRG